jgi:hypothetical protein
LKLVYDRITLCDFSIGSVALVFHFLLHDLAIFEYDFKCLFQFAVLLFLIKVFLLCFSEPAGQKIVLFFKMRAAFDLSFQFFIRFCELHFDEVDFLLGFFEVLLDAAFLVGDLVLQREQGIVGIVLVTHNSNY